MHCLSNKYQTTNVHFTYKQEHIKYQGISIKKLINIINKIINNRMIENKHPIDNQ